MSEKHDDPCQEAITTMRQRSLNELQRGAAGGRALAEQRGAAYLRQLAAAGGREKRRRAYAWPRTIRPWYGGVERRVPYWPARSTRRRRRPIFVRIEVQP